MAASWQCRPGAVAAAWPEPGPAARPPIALIYPDFMLQSVANGRDSAITMAAGNDCGRRAAAALGGQIVLDEGDLIIFAIGAFIGLFAGYWIRDRQSQNQKLRWRKRREAVQPASEKLRPRH